MSSFNRFELPTEIIEKIVRFLNIRDLISFGYTSTICQQLSRSVLRYKTSLTM